MFRKLVSNLAFSPALVGQLGFYAKRLKKEEATRRIGLIFTALALIVQSFAVFSPPEAANASSPSNFIPGGVSSVQDYLHHYDANTNNIKDLFTKLGITRNDIANAHQQQINSRDGMNSWALTPHFSYAQGERNYTIQTSSGGSRTYYARPLSLWDSGSNIRTGSYYYVYVGKISTGPMKGHWFGLMKVCGNLLLKEVPPKPACPTGTIGTYPRCTVPPKMCTIKGKEKLPASSPYCTTTTSVKPPQTCPLNPAILASSPDCLPCPGDSTLWIKDEKCSADIVLSKSASNITQGNIDAVKTTAKAGDKIIYTLNISNHGKAAASTTPTENLIDVSEYANVIENGSGTFDSTAKTLTWPATSLKPGETQTRMFTVQVLDTIPAMGQGVSDKTSYDCKMTNTFGNSVDIAVECPLQKQFVEESVAELPHTGPRENMLFAGAVLAVVVYFYARTRQVKKEIRLIRRDLNTGTI